MQKIIKYVLLDILKNRFSVIYTICLFLLTMGLYLLDSQSGKATLSMLNLVLLFVPMVSVIYTCIYYYNSHEFMTLLLSQPLRRRRIFFATYFGIALSLGLSFLLGCGLTVFILSPGFTSLSLMLSGLFLSTIFCGLAMLFAVYLKDKARGLGAAILAWIFFTILYDGILLLIMFGFADYPMDKIYILLTFLNPVDLARIQVLMQLDISALMGVTGAVFKDFFGSFSGSLITIITLTIWCVVPVWIAARHFRLKDF